MFPSELKAMYQTLRSTGALSYSKVEKAFEDHQTKWPEAIFNEDSWFKYLAPLEEKGSAAYLAMLQGSKAEQRKWWLYNRFKYIDSKYNAGDSLTDVITLRGYAKSNITITPYADVYATVKYGSYLVQTRAARNQSYTMVCPLDNLNDTEIMIFSASQLADIGDLSALKVGYAEFVYATKLQQLILGNSAQNYSNGNLQTLYLGNNKLLKKLDVRNCNGLGTGDQKTVDLSGCTGIEEVYFDGTSITGVTLPNGGVLRVLHLPSTATALVIRNQPSLTDFTCPDLSNITTLWLENVGTTVDTMEILESLSTGSRVRIFGFTWVMEDESEISDIFDVLDDMRGLDQNGNNVETAQVYGTIHVENVSGSVIAHANARYPDITITYDHVSAVLTYRDNDGTFLRSETILDGAAPAITPTLTTKEDNRYTYTFLGWSTTQNGSVEPNVFDNITADTTVYAIYSQVEKTYTVRFFNGSTLLATYTNVAYGATITYSEIPTYTGSGNANDYSFTGFLPLAENISSDLDCYAQFTFTGVYFRAFLDASITAYTDVNELTAIAEYAFAGLTSLVSVSMPSLTSVPASCFMADSSLTDINLPAVLAVNKYSFTSLSSLESLTLPEMLLLNEHPEFSTLNALKELRMPKNTSSLGVGQASGLNSVAGAANLEILDIGVTENIGMLLTIYRKLKYLIVRNPSGVVTPSTSNSSIFYASAPIASGSGLILVPKALVDSYKAASKWSNYASYIEGIEDHAEICG